MCLKRYDDQQIHCFGQGAVNITTEMRLQFQHATVYQVMTISIPTQTNRGIRTHILDNTSIRHRTTGHTHFCLKGNDNLLLRLSSGYQYGHGEASPISALTAQSMIVTERLRAGIHSAPAGWSSTFDTVLHSTTNHETTGLCVTYG
jgi:hypothetical protein